MEVRFVGDLQDKRATCQYCGTELDLTDTYQQVKRQQEREKRPWGTRTVETTVIETRSDRAGDLADGPVPEFVDGWLEERGISIPEGDLQQRLKKRGRLVIFRTGLDRGRVTLRRTTQETGREDRNRSGVLKVLDFLSRGGSTVGTPDVSPVLPSDRSLTPDEIIEAAGGPLPPGERRECPECGATISRQASRCTWCGAWFEDQEARQAS
jgi:hypothetical protein